MNIKERIAAAHERLAADPTLSAKERIEQHRRAWVMRRLSAIRSKLECNEAQLIRWDRDRTGADIPVFVVPENKHALAVSLGLRVA